MDIFKLVGSIVINGSEKAGQAIEGVSKTVQGLKKKVEEYKKTGTSTSDAWKKATQEMKESTQTSAGGIEDAFRKIGTAVTAFVALDKIKDFGACCIQAAADAKAMESQFVQVFEGVEISASKCLSVIADNTGINENRMKGSFAKIAAFAQTTGMETEASLSLAERAMIAVADSAAFYDRSLEDTTESLQSFLKGNYENDSALGLSCTETTRNTAANNLYGKSFNELSEAQKQLTLLKMVEDANKLSGAIGQAARESDTWTNQTGNLKQAWADFTAMIGEKILPLAVDIVKKASEIVTWLKEHETVVLVLAVAIGTLTAALIAYNVAQSLATTGMTLATAAGAAFGTVMAFITSPITLVIAAIGALIAIIVLCVKHWDDIKYAASNAWEWIKGVWNSVATWFDTKVIKPVVGFFKDLWNDIVGIFQSVIDWVKNNWESIVLFIINPFAGVFNYLYENFEGFRNFIDNICSSIKQFFVNLGDSIKLPHIGISPSGWKIADLLKGSIPKLSIEWYAKAMNDPMLMTEPTIFGYNSKTGQLQGGGEVGSEVVSGTNTLMNMIGNVVESKTSSQSERIIVLLSALLDATVGGNEEMLQALLADKTFAVGEREFARLVKQYA